jgi:methionyl-tRNA formyltransferase
MFRLDEGVDTGPLIAALPIDLTAKTTATELYETVNRMHVTLMLAYWEDIVHGRVTPVPQDESKATQWPVRRPEDGALSHRMTMAEADRLVRAVTHPYPGAFFDENGQRTVVWSASTGRENRPGAFRLADGYLYPLDTERPMGQDARPEGRRDGRESEQP